MFSELKEGTTTIIVPEQLKRSMFYNPKMELCRDIDVAGVSAFTAAQPSRKQPLYIDALAGSGVRGVRLANEVGLCLHINDRSTPAYELIKRNIALNALEGRARAYNENANILLLQTRYEMVDLDPFGSPIPFLDAACKSVKRLLLVTATDTAPLCGAHTGGMRKYAAKTLNTDYHTEMATRVLLGAVTRDMCKYDKAIQPLLSYSTAHFIRIIARVERGAKRADACMNRLGFITHCFSCGNRCVYADIKDLKHECTVCGAKVQIAGPLYLHAIKENAFCEKVHDELGKRDLGKKSEALKLVGRCGHELDIPYYFEHHAICKALKIPPPPIATLIDALRSVGFHASRTHFSDIAIKTDARIDAIKDILRGLSR